MLKNYNVCYYFMYILRYNNIMLHRHIQIILIDMYLNVMILLFLKIIIQKTNNYNKTHNESSE